MDKSALLPSKLGAPEWAEDMTRKYASSALSLFILHGNVNDLVPFQRATGTESGSTSKAEFLPLVEFLTDVFFAQRSLVITYDLSSGIQVPRSEMRAPLMAMVRAIDTVRGTKYADEGLPKEPLKAIELIARLVRGRLSGSEAAQKRVAVIIKYAETVFPEAEGFAAPAERAAPIALTELCGDPDVLGNDVTIVLVAESVAGLARRVQAIPYGAVMRLPLPDETTRESYIKRVNATAELDLPSEVIGVLKMHTSGLTLVQIRALLQEAKLENVDFGHPDYIYRRKREMIETECRGMLEFVQPKYKLDMVAVHRRAVEELRRDAELVLKGHLDAVPMGYLITGPSGSGKSFLIKAYAGEIGIPCVELKNFRDKWVGATEQNLEQIITLLAGLAPVVCIIDEADAYLGTREGEGDSGVSGRVFSRLTSFMGDTANRGKILWFLLTNRPDLLAIDLKRQGRAEKHIPLFPPETEQDYEELFDVLRRKNSVAVSFENLFGAAPEGAGLSLGDVKQLNGADIEALMVRSKGIGLLAGRQQMSPEDFKEVLSDYQSPVYPQQIEYQILQAVQESTSKSLIPERWRLDPAAIARRIEELRMYI
ncbi:MAG: AAA family ATPase [bacterium]|nr:AAA family ATPase [bacterium]